MFHVVNARRMKVLDIKYDSWFTFDSVPMHNEQFFGSIIQLGSSFV
jgi:hypothetical protein